MCVNTVLNEEHFEFFQDCCKVWIDKFGLKDWKFSFGFTPQDENFRAFINSDTPNRIAHINLEKVWKDSYENDAIYTELKYVALHEILHNVLAQLLFTVQYRSHDVELLDCAEHAVIMRLSNLLLKEDE